MSTLVGGSFLVAFLFLQEHNKSANSDKSINFDLIIL